MNSVNLWFAVVERDGELIVLHCNAVIGGKKIAQDSASCVWVIGNGTLDLLAVLADVGQRNKGSATGERVELVISVPLNLSLCKVSAGLAQLVDLANERIHGAIGDHISPESFAILGIVSTSVLLFSSVVDDGNTLTSKDVGDGILVQLEIILAVEETGIVVVINEQTQNRGVNEQTAVVLLDG